MGTRFYVFEPTIDSTTQYSVSSYTGKKRSPTVLEGVT